MPKKSKHGAHHPIARIDNLRLRLTSTKQANASDYAFFHQDEVFQARMRSYTSSESDKHCSDCLLLNNWCICKTLTPIDTRMTIIIVRHWREKQRTSNTARLAGLALRQCHVLDWDIRDEDFALGVSLNAPGTSVALLFPPDGQMHEMPSTETLPSTAPDVLIVLDGTWRQTRRMVRRIDGIQTLPRVFVTPPPLPRERLRTPPRAWAMSTIEAIARTISHYECEDKATQLDDAYNDLVIRIQQQRGGGGI